MDCDELLQTSHSPKSRHCLLPSSEGQVRILGPIVDMTTCFVMAGVPDHLHRDSIRGEFVCYDDLQITVPPHCFLQELQGSSFVPLLGDMGPQHFCFTIDGSPQVMPFAGNFDEDLVQVPLPLRAPPHGYGPPFQDIVRKRVPNRPNQRRTLSWQIPMPRSWRMPSTFRRAIGNLTYISTSSRMISEQVLKQRNGSYDIK